MFTIYPNPTNGILSINLKENLLTKKYKIYDIRGLVIKVGVFENIEQTIDISKYQNGIYILKIESGNSSIIRKIIKE